MLRHSSTLAVLVVSVRFHVAAADFTLQEKVDACHSVLLLAMTRIEPPAGQQTNSPTFAEAKVLEVLKGPSELKEIRFCYGSHGDFARAASQVVSNKQYVAFLCYTDGRYWAFQGAAGLRPVAGEYQERCLGADGKRMTEIFNHANYLKTIRRFACVEKVSISDLLTHRRKYFGKRVEVSGHYISGFEHSGLYETKEDSQRYVEYSKSFGPTFNGLHISPFAKPGYESRVRPIKEGPVRVIGTFSYNIYQENLGVGHLNQWPAELVALELFEAVD